MSKKKEARLATIRQILTIENRVKIVDLAKQLHVTPETLRTDLNELESRNIIVREHGYARIVNAMTETPLAMRREENPELKKPIMVRAMKEIQDGMVVFLDAGSTVLLGAPFLSSKKDLTIVTNSIPLANQCALMNLDIIFVGGVIFNNGLRTYGYFSDHMIDSMHFDVAIIGTDGIRNSKGLTSISEGDISVKRHVINQSKVIIGVCDSSKFSTTARFEYCKFHEIDKLITNQLTPDQVKQIKGVKEIIQV
ncbi:MAG: DeoR/GlpR transcriptional regulator [Holdemanella sp.]|nr:DeoR/GlpR transcriptional regulator [Holdemanella sp.]